MTSRSRFAIKILFILIFIILAPLIIAYTMGYRYNFQVGQIQKTGVLILNTFPDDADVYLNGKIINDKTPSVIKKILPNEYTVEVVKDDYHTWSKKLEVRSGETTFAESIVLFSDEVPRALFDREINQSIFSPNRSQLIYTIIEASWIETWLFSLKNQEFTLIDRRDTAAVENMDFKWSSGSNRVYLKIESDESIERLIYDINKNKLTNLNEHFEESIDKFKWSRTSDDVFYVLQNRKLISVNLLTNQKTFLLSDVGEFFIRGNNIYLIINDGGKSIISQFDIIEPLKEIEKLYELPFANYDFEDSSYPYLMLKKNDKEILLFDTSAPFAEPILQEDAVDISWHTTNQGEKKLLYFKDFEIWIFYPQSKYNELITRFSTPITNALWHRNGEYIFFSFNNAIKVIELDQREKRNVFDLITEADIANFTVDYNSESLYFIGRHNKDYGLHHLQLIVD